MGVKFHRSREVQTPNSNPKNERLLCLRLTEFLKSCHGLIFFGPTFSSRHLNERSFNETRECLLSEEQALLPYQYNLPRVRSFSNPFLIAAGACVGPIQNITILPWSFPPFLRFLFPLSFLPPPPSHIPTHPLTPYPQHLPWVATFRAISSAGR